LDAAVELDWLKLLVLGPEALALALGRAQERCEGAMAWRTWQENAPQRKILS
jgi:hypothetical protein